MTKSQERTVILMACFAVIAVVLLSTVMMQYVTAQTMQTPPPPPIDTSKGPILSGNGTEKPMPADEPEDSINRAYDITGTFYDNKTNMHGTLEIPLIEIPDVLALHPCIVKWVFADGTEELRLFFIIQYKDGSGNTVCYGADWKSMYYLRIVTEDGGETIKWRLYPVQQQLTNTPEARGR